MQRIVYSTCSVHAIENEHVVRQALKMEEATSGGFRLAPRKEVLPKWHRRGIPNEMDAPGALSVVDLLLKLRPPLRLEDAEALVRCSPGEDATNGFFVSLIMRKRDQVEDTAEIDMKKRKMPEDGGETSERAIKRQRKKKKKRPDGAQ